MNKISYSSLAFNYFQFSKLISKPLTQRTLIPAVLTRNFSDKKTALHGEHLHYGGKMVSYAGHSLPIEYQKAGVKEEHLHTRNFASVFDVSHMAQVKITGKDREKFIQRICPVDTSEMKNYEAKLSVMLNDKGGIIDDTVITKLPTAVMMVLNGACAEKDLIHLQLHKKLCSKDFPDVTVQHLDNKSLLALQGPLASSIVQNLLDTSVKQKISLDKVAFMSMVTSHSTNEANVTAKPNAEIKSPEELKIGEVDVEITRCGYTGEDGFEISCDNLQAPKLLQILLGSNRDLKLAGLGARDSLRIEAGLCLYGNDISEQISPIEAGLLFTIPKSRRHIDNNELKNFIGATKIIEALSNDKLVASLKRRIGITIAGPPARGGNRVFDKNTEEKLCIGETTSGTFSPTLKCPISLAYLSKAAKIGDEVYVEVRNKLHSAKVTKLPFIPAKYHRLQ